MVCQYEKNRIASRSRMTQVIGPICASPAAPVATRIESAASGPYAADPSPSSPIAGRPVRTPSLRPSASLFATGRPMKKCVSPKGMRPGVTFFPRTSVAPPGLRLPPLLLWGFAQHRGAAQVDDQSADGLDGGLQPPLVGSLGNHRDPVARGAIERIAAQIHIGEFPLNGAEALGQQTL